MKALAKQPRDEFSQRSGVLVDDLPTFFCARLRALHGNDRSQVKALQLRLDLRKAGFIFRGWQITSIIAIQASISCVKCRQSPDVPGAAAAYSGSLANRTSLHGQATEQCAIIKSSPDHHATTAEGRRAPWRQAE